MALGDRFIGRAVVVMCCAWLMACSASQTSSNSATPSAATSQAASQAEGDVAASKPRESLMPAAPQARPDEVVVLEALYLPQGAGAVQYGKPKPAKLRRGEAYAVQRQEGRVGLHDPGLSTVARELAFALPDWGAMPPALIEGLMNHHGVVGPTPRVYTVTVHDVATECRQLEHVCKLAVSDLARLVGKSEELFGRRRFGVGLSVLPNGDTRMLMLVVDDLVELKPFDRRFERRRDLHISGKLLAGRNNPHLEVIDPKGVWRKIPAVLGDDDSFEASIRCEFGVGRYQVEIVADGPLGPQVAANIPVYCDENPPVEIAYAIEKLGDNVSVQQVIDESFRRLNQARKTRGLMPLEWDDGLARVALEHAEDMAQTGHVAHVSPTRGTLADRIRRARIEYDVVRENVARGNGPGSIHESLLGSPGHRANMLSSDVTHVGIAAVFKHEFQRKGVWERAIYLTQEFADRGQITPGDDQLESVLVARANFLRSQKGLPPLQVSKKLSVSAAKDAKIFARGGTGLAMAEHAKVAHQLKMAKVFRRQLRSNTWKELLTLSLWTEISSESVVGIDVRRVPQSQEGGYVVVLLDCMPPPKASPSANSVARSASNK